VNPEGSFKVFREVRDLQVVDRDETNCGICDDVEFQGAPGQTLVAHALLLGTGAMYYRLPSWLARFTGFVFPAQLVRIPWDDVETVTSRIKLKHPASHYGLLRTDRSLARYLKWIPAL
jgi:hypothetical protein